MTVRTVMDTRSLACGLGSNLRVGLLSLPPVVQPIDGDPHPVAARKSVGDTVLCAITTPLGSLA